ncbi:retrovirus-related pol polyprotein from transposon TNT 1-94 [Tanacetum coccineum]|uniref:Retrovirus-related pol polyprotein from transposon TNT 1-94 n=1 Tax=Tanacetum coccineum TaxID=301880 RepID=A0ABQ5DNE3_9ASTR
MIEAYTERMKALLAAQKEQELREQEQTTQEKEEPPHNSIFRQLIEEVCGTKVCEKQKQNMEDTMLELLEDCRKKEIYCIPNDVEDLIERTLNSKLLSINLKSQCLDKEKQEVKNTVEQAPKPRTRLTKCLNFFKVIHKESIIPLNKTPPISSVNAITPDLPTVEPDNSLSMGDEHLSTIPEMESDEVIKSSVENLVPIPSESEGISDDTCNVPVYEYSSTFDALKNHYEILSDSDDDGTPSDDDSFENIEYVEASPPDFELVSLEEVNDVDQEKEEIDLEDIIISQQSIRNRGKAIVTSSAPTYDPEPDSREAGYDNQRAVNVAGDRGKCRMKNDDLEQERDCLPSLISETKMVKMMTANRNKFLESSNKELVDKLKGEIEDFKTKYKSLESSNSHFKEANNELSKTNQLMFKDLKKFQAELDKYNDVNYASGCYNDNLALMLAPDSDETIRLEKERRSKLSDLIRQFDYGQLNNLYGLFVPQREKLVEQHYFPKTSKMSHTSSNKEFSQESFRKQTTLLEKRSWDESFLGSKVRPQLKSNHLEDRVMSNNSQGKKQEVEDHRRKFKFSNNKTSVTACNDSLNAKTSNVNFVCVTCGKCVLNDNHDLCVLHYINGVNSRTRQPMAVPVSTREPKHNVNQSVATFSKKTVATDSTVKKSRNITRKLYEQVSKTCSWWYPKYTPPGYNWKPKSQKGNVNPNISMPLGNASRTANILEHKTPRCSTVSNTPLSSNSFAARRDHSIHRRLWGNDLLIGSHGTYLYSITLQDLTTPNPICLMSKSTSSQAWLWHRRLSYLNFDTINLLSKNNIVNGLPKLKFVKDHLCSSCELGKAKRKSFHTKTTPSSKRRLQLLHMDLCGLMRVESINGKKYVLVIVDDYSRYTWTHFLRSKDETPGVLIDFLTWPQTSMLDDVCSQQFRSQTSMSDDICSLQFMPQTSMSDDPRTTVSTEVHQAAETVTTSNELVLLFGPLFDEYFNGENQVVLKSSAVTNTDASDKRQQQPDSTSFISTLATSVTANGNFDLVLRIILEILPEHLSDTQVFTVKMEILLEPTSNKLLVGLDEQLLQPPSSEVDHKPHAHTQAFKSIFQPQVDQGSQIKMIQVKEMMQDNDLKNSMSKDKGSRSRSQSMNEQSHYKQEQTITGKA